MLKQTVASTTIAMIVLGSAASPQQSSPASEHASRIEALVDKAAALVESRGKAAFADFRKHESEWWFGNTYLFAYDQDLNVLLNPAFPKREGTNPRGVSFPNGDSAEWTEEVFDVLGKGAGTDS